MSMFAGGAEAPVYVYVTVPVKTSSAAAVFGVVKVYGTGFNGVNAVVVKAISISVYAADRASGSMHDVA
jgi:hypothetical protein